MRGRHDVVKRDSRRQKSVILWMGRRRSSTYRLCRLVSRRPYKTACGAWYLIYSVLLLLFFFRLHRLESRGLRYFICSIFFLLLFVYALISFDLCLIQKELGRFEPAFGSKKIGSSHAFIDLWLYFTIFLPSIILPPQLELSIYVLQRSCSFQMLISQFDIRFWHDPSLTVSRSECSSVSWRC